MSNNTPDYIDNLAFEPDVSTMPRCDIEELKGKLDLLQTSYDFDVSELQTENNNLIALLKECENELKIMRMLSLTTASANALNECDNLITRINAAIGESEE